MKKRKWTAQIVYRNHRTYRRPEGKYLLRDVWSVKGQFLGCQYFHAKRWIDCAEGSKFSDIKPVLP